MKLYILPFDHRSSFSKIILGTEKPDKEQKEKLKKFKEIIFNGLLESLEGRKDRKDFAILVDEEYGQKILLKAKEEKIKICLPVEKSGEELLKLHYGNKFKEHISKFSPDYVKILIRYNPINTKQNQKQLSVLSEIKDFCNENKFKTIVELLVPPTEKDLEICKSKEIYDKTVRAERTTQAIKEIKKVLRPTIWKLEGFNKKNWPQIVSETKGSKIILLGRGEDDRKVRQWLKDASEFESIIGFAIGRTIFIDAIKQYNEGKIDDKKASKLIANKFLSFVNNWEKYGKKDQENI
jgi:5-dehydro-2-deoxygluconokinase